MCDYSLQTVRSRPAKVGEKLRTHHFNTGTRGSLRRKIGIQLFAFFREQNLLLVGL
jgi:hypothetical protein